METDEMIEILEAIVRDPDTPATARITGIRTLNQIAPPPSAEDDFFADLES
jgi:uncharacterized protein (UPF0147 family)